MVTLEEVAKDLKDRAKLVPPLNAQKILGALSGTEKPKIEYAEFNCGITVKLGFSFDELPAFTAEHLSVSNMNGGHIGEELLDRIKNCFFNDASKIGVIIPFKTPSLFVNNCFIYHFYNIPKQ